MIDWLKVVFSIILFNALTEESDSKRSVSTQLLERSVSYGQLLERSVSYGQLLERSVS